MAQPHTLGPDVGDSEGVIRSSQNKVGACSTNGCIGLIALVAVIGGSTLIAVSIVLGLRRYRRKKERVRDVELQQNSTGRPDREEFALANPPTQREMRNKRLLDKLRLKETKQMENKDPGRDSPALSPKSIIPKGESNTNPITMQDADRGAESVYNGHYSTPPGTLRRNVVADSGGQNQLRDSVASSLTEIEAGKHQVYTQPPSETQDTAQSNRNNTGAGKQYLSPPKEARPIARRSVTETNEQYPAFPRDSLELIRPRRSNTDASKPGTRPSQGLNLSSKLGPLKDINLDSPPAHAYSQPRRLGSNELQSHKLPGHAYVSPMTDRPEYQFPGSSSPTATTDKKGKGKSRGKEETCIVDELQGRRLPKDELDGRQF